jgi:hypothetical protein
MPWFDRNGTDHTSGSDAVAKLQGRVFRPSPHVVWTTLRGETVVFDVDRGKYESLNDVATSVWELLADGASFGRITDAMQEQYELTASGAVDQMVQDVAALLTRLEKARVISSEKRS